MTITTAQVNFMWQTVIIPRVGDVYVFGGSLSPGAVNQGTDCSGACSEAAEGIEYGPQMNWQRQFYTGTFAGANPGDRGPFGGCALTSDWTCIASPQAAPPGAALIAAVLQLANPEDAHMVCAVLDPDNVTGYGPGYVGIESGGSFTDANGNSTLHIGPEATSVGDPEFNQWFCTGPIIDAPPIPVPPAPPLTPAQQGGRAIIAAGDAMGITPLGCQMGLACALVESNMQMYANSNVPESLNYAHDAVGSDHDSCGPFQQRASTGWGTVACEMDWACSASLFFTALAKLPYNSGNNTPGSYVQQVQGSAFPDRYDQRFNDAVALYNSLINLPAPEGFLMALTDQQQNDVYNAICGHDTSQSPFRQLGEGAIWEPAQMWRNDDGMTHPQYVTWAASLGDPVSLAVLNAIANGDVTQYPDRIEDIRLAQQVLARIGSPTPAPTPGPSPSPTPAPGPLTPTPAPTPTGNITVKTTTVVHSVITLLGGGLAIGTWVLHSFGGVMTPGITTAVSTAVALGTALLDFLVKETGNP